MGIRLVAFDLDGTVLDDNKCLSDENRRALAACVKKGIRIVPCTGRMAGGIPREILDLGVRYAVTINGGTIEDLCERRILDRQLLRKQTAIDIIKLAMNCSGVMCDAYVDEKGISEFRYYDHLEQYGFSAQIVELIRQTRTGVPDLVEYISRPESAVNKINLYFADLSERGRMRERLRQFADIRVTSSVENNLEINSRGASKGSALKRLTELLGINIRETMAIGDGENDYTMIKEAGIGVAMGNAEETLKTAADYVTGSNNDAGVAQVIAAFVPSG